MKNRFFVSIAIFGMTALLMSSCSKLPQAEIDAANAAIEQAKIAGADIYVPENFMALKDSMNSVIVSVESQKSKFIKNYSASKEQLEGVSQFAAEVKLQSETRIDELKIKIQATIDEVNGLILSNRQLIQQAPKGKEGTLALVAIKGEVDALEISNSEASALSESGNYIASLNKALAAQEKAMAIQTELSNVIAKYKANVRTK